MSEYKRPCDEIAEILCEEGLDAFQSDGWVHINLSDGRTMTIAAEYGASLDISIYQKKIPRNPN